MYKCINILNFIKSNFYNFKCEYIENERKFNYLILNNFNFFKNILYYFYLIL